MVCVVQPSGLAISYSMPFSRLAVVEVQLVMHCLDRHSLLRFARCNRATLAAASCEFAWNGVDPFKIDLHHHDVDFNTADRINASLMRFCAINITWNASYRNEYVGPVSAIIIRIPRVVRINVKLYGISAAMWNTLLSHPSMARVTALKDCSGSLGDANPFIIARLPRLQALHMCHISKKSIELQSLGSFPHLTDLNIMDGRMQPLSDTDEDVLHIANATGLRCLSFIFHESVWLRILETSCSTHTLHTLSLGVVSPRSDVSVYGTCFASLPALTSISIRHCNHVDAFLLQIVRAPRLHHISLCVPTSSSLIELENHHPSADVLRTLLRTFPVLSFLFRLLSPPGIGTAGKRGDTYDRFDRSCSAWSMFAAQYASRIELQNASRS
jgi:hypothetical protein